MLTEQQALNQLEESLKKKGLPIVKKDVKVGRIRPDMVAYKLDDKGTLIPEIVIEFKSDPNPSSQQQLMRYVKELGTRYALLATIDTNYWFDGNTFLPIEEPEFDIQYIVKEKDIESVIREVMDQLRGSLRHEQIANAVLQSLLARAYLNENEKMDTWWSVKNEDDLINLIYKATDYYSLNISPMNYGLTNDIIQFFIMHLSSLPAKSSALQNVLLNIWDSKAIGQYLSPEHVRKIFADLTNQLDFNKEKTIDLAAGIGSIAFEVMKANNINHMVGIETQKETCALLEILSILGGYGSINAVCTDTLQSHETLQKSSYSLTLVDPPLGFKYKLSEEQISDFQVANKRTKNDITDLFIEKAIQITETGGYILALVPEKVLFSGPSQITRGFIKEHTIIEAIISLPPHTLKPYTAIKLSLLILRKKEKTSETAQELFLAQAESVDEFDEIVKGFADWKTKGDNHG